MTHMFEDSKKWNALSADEKLGALHEGIGKLFTVVEELSHKNHVFVDAINLVHGRLDLIEKHIHRMESHTHQRELTD